MEYRERFYAAYLKTHLSHLSTRSKDSYELLCKGYKKRFGPFLPSDRSARILEVGCGTGEFLYFLKCQGYSNAFGIDRSLELLGVARRFGIENVQVNDIFSFLEENQERFDFIAAHDVIEHFSRSEVVRFLDLCFQALRPEGKVLLSTPNAQSIFGARNFFVDFTHEVCFTAASLLQVLAITNFVDIRVCPKGPVVYDLPSGIRFLMWQALQFLAKSWWIVEHGTGRGLSREYHIYSESIFAVATKP